MSAPQNSKEIFILDNHSKLTGDLSVPSQANKLVLFAHGSGSSRHSVRNQYVAQVLNKNNIATLLFDLLTLDEEAIDDVTAQFRFDLKFLAKRLIRATNWVLKQPELMNMSIGYFGASTGGGAALIAAAMQGDIIKAIVSRGGRPDLANEYLPLVQTPTLLIVGGDDTLVIEMNKEAMQRMQCIKKLDIVPDATHLFEEPGTLEEVARLASHWFLHYL